MASISTEPNGTKIAQVICPDGVRRSIRIGKVDAAAAAQFGKWLQTIADTLRHGQPLDGRTLKWLAALPDVLHSRIARAHLVDPRERRGVSVVTLAGMIDDYIARRTDVKPSTAKNYHQAKASLVAYFGPAKDVRTITTVNAEDFKRDALTKLARATVAMRMKKAKLFFSDAKRRGIVDASPFDGVPAGSDRNAKRVKFIPRAVVDKVIDTAKSPQWKLLIALSRYGGIRVPSEMQRLRWCDVLFAEKKFIVHSTKTEHHEGKETRVVPMFAELEPLFLQAFNDAEPGEEFVLTGAMRHHSNLSTTFKKIVKRAGFAPWPRLWHNLRGSRENELMREFPAHVAVAWIGNDIRTALAHYLSATDEDYAKAIGGGAEKTSAQTSAEIARTPLQVSEAVPVKPWKTPGNPASARIESQRAEVAALPSLPLVGLEPTLERFSVNFAFSVSQQSFARLTACGALSGARAAGGSGCPPCPCHVSASNKWARDGPDQNGTH